MALSGTLSLGVNTKIGVKLESGNYGKDAAVADAIHATAMSHALANIKVSLSNNFDDDRAKKRFLDGTITTLLNNADIELFYAHFNGGKLSNSKKSLGNGMYEYIFEQPRVFLDHEPLTHFYSNTLKPRATLVVNDKKNTIVYPSSFFINTIFDVSDTGARVNWTVRAYRYDRNTSSNAPTVVYNFNDGHFFNLADFYVEYAIRELLPLNGTILSVTQSGTTSNISFDRDMGVGEAINLITRTLNDDLPYTFSARYIPPSNKVVLSSMRSFTINSGSANAVLGFSNNSTGSIISGSHPISSYNITDNTSFKRIKVSAFNVNFGTSSRQADGADGSFVMSGLNKTRLNVSVSVLRLDSDVYDFFKALQYGEPLVMRFFGESRKQTANPEKDTVELFCNDLLVQSVSTRFSEAAPGASIDFRGVESGNIKSIDAIQGYDYVDDPIVGTNFVTAIGACNGFLYLAGGSLYQSNGVGYRSLGTLGFITNDIICYKGDIYLAGESGAVDRYDGNNLSTIATLGGGDIIKMVLLDKHLYLLSSSGVLYRYDGNTFTTIGSVGTSYDMAVYNGDIYIGASSAIYKYDGNSMLSDVSQSGTPKSLCLYGGRLYALCGSTMRYKNGNSWGSFGNAGITGYKILNYRNSLIILRNSTDDLYLYNFADRSADLLISGISGGSFSGNGYAIYQNILYCVVGTGVQSFSANRKGFVRLKSPVNHNPF